MTLNHQPQASWSDESATAVLKRLMVAADIPSFRTLCRTAGVSEWSVRQVRRDRITQMRVDTLQSLAQALKLSLPELLEHFGVVTHQASPSPSSTDGAAATGAVVADYHRLQAQYEAQAATLQQQFQQEVLTAIESWLVQWPTVVHAVNANPDLPATRLLPLVQPVQTLLEQWGITAIAAVGQELPYNPYYHELLSGTAAPGDLVKVRYTGFTQGERLLYRARVSPVG